MKDLVPKGTGNSRFLRSSIPSNITHEELVALLRSGKFPVDLAGLNSEGVAVVGSAYSKANVLPDGVCNRLRISTTDSEPKDAFLAAATAGWYEYERITTSKNWVVPDGVYRIGVFAQGGGASGESGDLYRNDRNIPLRGGSAGHVCCGVLNVTPGQTIAIVIGAGGVPNKQYSGPGGDTKVGVTITAPGGNSGITGYAYNFEGYTCPTLEEGSAKSGLYMYSPGDHLSVPVNRLGNIFDPSMIIGSVGGSINHTEDGNTVFNTPTKCDLGIGGAATINTYSNATGKDATGNGCGGGAALSGNDKVYKGGLGSPGIVIIYV